MPALILLGVPERFDCLWAAAHSVRAATQKGCDRIRVEKPGHVCEYAVDALRTYLRRHHPKDSLVRAGTVDGHRRMGNTFERRLQVWPGLASFADSAGVKGT